MDRLTYDEIVSRHNYGITTAVNLSWHDRDTGRDWLCVERGSAHADDGREYWLPSGVIVGTAHTRDAAERYAKGLRRKLRNRGCLSARVDVVARHSVVVKSSRQPYGCSM